MRIICIALCILSFWLGTIGETAVQTFSATGEYTMSDVETPQVAEQRAIAYARQRAAEQAGVYVASYTRTEGMSVAEDEIKALASNSLKITEQKTFKAAQPNGDVHIKAEITAKVDTSDIDQIIKSQGAERERKREALTQAYRDMQDATAKFEKKNEVLRQKIAEAKTRNQDISALKEENKSQEREFLSNQKVEEAIRLWQAKQLSESEKACNEALQLNPKNPRAYNYRGIVYSQKKEYERAIADCNRALTIDSLYSPAYNNRGIVYSAMKNNTRAMSDYNRALELDPKFVEAYGNRGNAYCDMGDYARAVADYNRALELNPKLAGAYQNRGIVYCLMKDYARALEDQNRALELNPQFAEAYGTRGIVYHAMKDYPRAVADYNRALELDSKLAAAYFHRSLAYASMGQFEKALSDVESVLRLEPNYPNAQKLRQQLLDDMRRR